MKYGMAYKGSKSQIANEILENLPDADIFVDLFGGGGAITHAAVLSNRYKKVIYNEFNKCVADGFRKAVNGDYANEKRWISREDFFRLKQTDFYAASCFSFGNDLNNYAYSKEVEPWKRALHYARLFGDCSELEKFGIKTDGTRADIIGHKDEYKKKYIAWYFKNVLMSPKEYDLTKAELERNIKEESEKLRSYLINARDNARLKSSDIDKHLGTNGIAGHYFGRSQWEFPTRENYEKMREIMPTLEDYNEVAGLAILYQSLESLQRLQSLERLEILNLSYEQVKIPENVVVYCDIPYRNTGDYNVTFNHDTFYQWARSAPFDVYISEYQMPEDFECVYEQNHRTTLGTGNNTQTVEKLFCNHKGKKIEQLSFF